MLNYDCVFMKMAGQRDNQKQSMNKYEYISSAIKITVPEYKESKIEGNTVFFVIEVANRDNKWMIEKRFSEFDNLVKALKVNYHNIPALPGKNYIFKMTDKDLEVRRAGLEEFLQALVCRNDLMNSEQVKQFLQLDKNAAEAIVNPPRLQDEFNIGGSNSKGVRDFAYVKEDDTFYIVAGDMNPVSRLNAYVTNAKMPWEKDTGQKEKVLMEVGSVEAWSGTGSNFNQKWFKNYPSQAITLEHNAAGERALVGLDDGILDILKVSPTGFEDIVCVKIHQNRIMGISYDHINGIVYTISEDKTFRISEATTLMMILSLPHREPLLVMMADKINKRVFIGSKGGDIYIYDVSSKHTAKLLNTLTTNKRGSIRGMDIDLKRNYLFTGGFDDGELAIFDIDKPNREKYAKQVASLQGKQKVRSIAWIPDRSQLAVGTADGSITFWNAIKGKSLYVLQSSNQEVTKLTYQESTRTVIVSNKGKTIKFWTLPKEWRDAMLEAQEEKEAEAYRAKLNTERVKKAVEILNQDSDEDDLAGWHLD